MKIKNNKKANIILLALILVWFLLVMSIWMLKIILTESNDTYAMKNSLKAYYGAESALELALLKIKKKWFWIEWEIKKSNNWESVILAENSPIKKNDLILSYKINSKANSATWTIKSWNSEVYQLFYKTGSFDFSNTSTEKKAINIKLSIQWWDKTTWSIISRSSWLNWTWWIDSNTIWFWKKIESGKPVFFTGSINWPSNFLDSNSWSFLMIWNLNNDEIQYNLKTTWEFFTWKYTIILASAKAWKQMQNIELKVDNSKYLNIIKNVIYSKN